MTAALALAFAAGMVATLNPCGFAMLPAYLSYFMGLQDEDQSTGGAVRSGFAVGLVVSLGFFVVFAIAGSAITLGFRTVTTWIPWIALAVGFGVVGLGIAMLAGYQMTVSLPKASRAGSGKGWGRVFMFGVSYAIASLSCTLPVFLSVVATQLTQQSLLGGIAVFMAYALGMSLVLVALTVFMALGKATLVDRLRGSVRYVNRLSGAILVIAGLFIIWFWGTAILSGATALGTAPAFRFVENLSQLGLNFVADHTLIVAASLIGVLLAAIGFAWRQRATRTGAGDEDGGNGAEDLVYGGRRGGS
jgi:cytochrome c biogenesis protein CcdA